MSPRRRDGDSLRRGGDGTPGDPDHAPRTIVREQLDGYSTITRDDLDGYDRPLWAVLNEDEIVAEYGRQGSQPEIECGYCSQRHRARSVEGAISWWRAHECEFLFAAETSGLVYDLTPMLRDNRIEAEAA